MLSPLLYFLAEGFLCLSLVYCFLSVGLCFLFLCLCFSFSEYVTFLKKNNRVARRVRAQPRNGVRIARGCYFVVLFELFSTSNTGRFFRVFCFCFLFLCPCLQMLSSYGRGNPLGGWLKSVRFLRGSCRQLCCFRWLFESAKKVATSYTTWSPPFLTVIFSTQNKKPLKIR